MLELYIRVGCPHCDKRIEELEKKGLTYKLYNVFDDPSAYKEAKEKYGADKVPVLVENGEVKSIGFQGGG
ncbi:MAG: glutaredoxin domain-containing protein [Dethiobacteria bacterium]|jgi:glutaredoxin 3